MEENNNEKETLRKIKEKIPKTKLLKVDFLDFAKKNLLWMWRLMWINLTISTITLLLLIYLTVVLTNFVWVIKTPIIP